MKQFLIFLLVLATVSFSETTWTAHWNAANDNKETVGYVFEYQEDSVWVSQNVGDVLEFSFTSGDSVCGRVQAYDAAGNYGEFSLVECVASLKGTFDIVQDGRVNKIDADFWLETYPDTVFIYDPLFDVNADGKVYYDDLYVLNIKIYDLTEGGTVSGADVLEWQRIWNINPDSLFLDIDGSNFVTGKDKLDLINFIMKE